MGFMDAFLKPNGVRKDKLPSLAMDDPYRETSSVGITPRLVMVNDGVDICAICCAACWDTPLPTQYADRAIYVGKRSKTGHTSVIEHSNVVFYMQIPEKYYTDLIEFLANNNFLHTCVKFSNISDTAHMLVGGSWRAFSDLYLFATTIAGNRVLSAITNAIYLYIPSCGMLDVINKGILDQNEFADIEKVSFNDFNYCYANRIDDNINILNCDSIEALMANVNAMCPEPGIFTIKDMLKFVTVTIEFNGMSRIITQQLTRHRNGITQESQRYVDYSGAPFNSPAKFKPGKYNEKRLYEFSFGGQKFKMNLQNIGNAINGIYPQLRDKAKLGPDALIPEDARAYLANNTQCGKIFITFTYYNLIKFLQLREDGHAQVEIREFATRIGKWFRENPMAWCNSEDIKLEDLYDALKPVITDHQSIFSKYINPFENEVGDSDEFSKVSETMTDEEFEALAIKSIEQSDNLMASETNSEI